MQEEAKGAAQQATQSRQSGMTALTIGARSNSRSSASPSGRIRGYWTNTVLKSVSPRRTLNGKKAAATRAAKKADDESEAAMV